MSEKQEKGFFLPSSLDYEDSGQIRWLAIVETILAMIGTVLLAIFVLESWLYFFAAACCAPLLLRTEESTQLGLGWFHKIDHTFGRSVMWGVLIVLAPVVRFVATAYCSLRYPLRSIAAIPKNWRHIVLFVNMRHLPEVVAGRGSKRYCAAVGLLPLKLSELFYAMLGVFLNTGSLIRDELGLPLGALLRLRLYLHLFVVLFLYLYLFLYLFLYLYFFLFLFFFLFLLPLIYRFSVKSTAWVWLPLLWIVPKAMPKHSLQTRLEQLCTTPLSKFIHWLSLVNLLLFALKILLYSNFTPFMEYWNTPWVQTYLDHFVVKDKLPIWQLTGVINAVIAIGTYFLAGQSLPILRNKEKHNGLPVVDRITIVLGLLRAFLSVYTGLCLGYLFAELVWQYELPPLGDKWFPWQ